MRYLLLLTLIGCAQGSTFSEIPDSGKDVEVYHGCTDTCDDSCTCPPEYQACVTTCGSRGKKYCLPGGAVNSEGCSSYSNEKCIDDRCVAPDASYND